MTPSYWINATCRLAALVLAWVFACPAFAGNYIIAWGVNTANQTNIPAAATNVQAVAAGLGFSVALKSDGTVMAWGQNFRTNVPAGLSNVVAIATGEKHTLALRSDGTLAAWGTPDYSTLTNIPAGLSNIVAVSCGDDHNLVLRSNGTLYAWGANYSQQTNIPASLTNVVAISAGDSANIAVLKNGAVWLSYPPPSYFTNLLASSNNVAAALVAGAYQGALIQTDGTAHVWGYNTPTNTVIVSNAIAAACRSPFNQAGATWVLRRNGTLAGFGSMLGQSNVWSNLSNVLAVCAGYSHYMAIVGDDLPASIEPLSQSGFANGQFVIQQPTSPGHNYWLEYRDSLNDDWHIAPPRPGNGSTQFLADPNPPPSQRFYRVRTGP